MDIQLPGILGIDNFNIILGSASPRRKELLKGLGIKFTIDSSSHTEEIYSRTIKYSSIPKTIAVIKSEGFHRPLSEDEILITADTMVFTPENGNYIPLGKPEDATDAKRMLHLLSGKTHKVITGVCIRDNVRKFVFSSVSSVTFKILTNQEIDYYVDNYSPFDKAGAYAIQEWIGFIGISKINGSYSNVVGLPTQRLYKELVTFISNKTVMCYNKNVISKK